jgi:hypothetical protein
MKIAIKNFNRNEASNLVAISVKHFIPDAEIYLFNLYKDVINLDELDINLFEKIESFQTKYILGRGDNSPNNGYYYTEGFNIIHNYFQNLNDKLLILDENHFFTNGNTLKELLSNDFDVASGLWQQGNIRNASCLCINPLKTKHLFPLPEIKEYIEIILRDYFFKDKTLISYDIKNRQGEYYHNDGVWTNDVNIMKTMLKTYNIII